MNSVYGYFVVFLGAGIGGAVRHAINRASLPVGSAFPWGTLAINVTGSLLMGLLAGWYGFRSNSGQYWRLFLATGVLGGCTTFSAFSLEVALLYERGQLAGAATYAAGSVVISIAALFCGIGLMRIA